MSKLIQMKLNNENVYPKTIDSGNNSNGNYIKFSDGTMICYGTCPGTNTAHNTTSSAVVTFPKSFISDPTITLTIYASNWNATQYMFANVSTKNNLTQFTLRTRNSATASSGMDFSMSVYYMAIGKWK